MKKAVILFNLGGPDKLENVEPFLFNLFNDPAILNLPSFLRYPLAKLISNRRAPTAKKIYQELGGSSPILRLTEEQSKALELKLNIEDPDVAAEYCGYKGNNIISSGLKILTCFITSSALGCQHLITTKHLYSEF